MSKNLVVDWCSYKAAKYAVLNWHYSKRMPGGKLNTIGVWEHGEFVGAVVFGVGANKNMHKEFSLQNNEVCELVRVALREHEAPTTQIISRAMKLLKRHNPGLKLVLSYADPNVGHVGFLYQALSWYFIGFSQSSFVYVDQYGREYHARTLSPGKLKGRKLRLTYVKKLPKIKYAYAFDRKVRKELKKRALPYIKSLDVVRGAAGAPGMPGLEVGSTPTPRYELVETPAGDRV